MNIEKYLQRINYTGSLHPNLDTLKSLQLHHLYAIPFEDLDIYFGVPILLDTNSIYKKVVRDKRGGYCYELNTLFGKLLSLLGFQVSVLSGRFKKGKAYGPEFDHMALMVTIKERDYLVDVGFGDFSMQPLLIGKIDLQYDGRCSYRIAGITIDCAQYKKVDKWQAGKQGFVTEYIFTIVKRKIADFHPMHAYQQMDPGSHFVQNLICTIPNPDGRVSLVNNRLIITTNGHKKVMTISENERLEILKKYFDIDFAASALVPVVR